MKKLLTTLSILLIATTGCSRPGEFCGGIFYIVEHVIDGNTIQVSYFNRKQFEKIRLIGIDTPESRDNDKARRDSERTGQDLETINKMRQEATNFLRRLLKKGDEVRLDLDVQEKDKYGRLLAYVWIDFKGSTFEEFEEITGLSFQRDLYGLEAYFHDVKTETIFINASIIKAGYATPMTIPPNVKHADLFKRLYEEAREQKRGLWR